MRKVREVLEEDGTRRNGRKTARGRSEARLRRLFDQAARTTDPRKKALIKEEFIREFYEGAR